MNTLSYGYSLGYIPALAVCARFNESGQLGFMWVLCGLIFPFFAVGCHLGHTQTSSVKAVGVLTVILALPSCAVLPKIPGRLAAMIYSTGLSSLTTWHWAVGLGSLNCGGGHAGSHAGRVMLYDALFHCSAQVQVPQNPLLACSYWFTKVRSSGFRVGQASMLHALCSLADSSPAGG